MICYAIKNENGKYWLGGFYGKNNVGTIIQAHIYQTERTATTQALKIRELYSLNVKVVKVEIREVEDERD